MHWLNGIVVAGYGVASGRGKDARFPIGTIREQMPFFRARGVDLSPYFPGTLNVDLAPLVPAPSGAVFDGVLRWRADIEERFLLSLAQVELGGRVHRGLWYYPDPLTKREHFQKDSVVELLLPRIEGLAPGVAIKVKI